MRFFWSTWGTTEGMTVSTSLYEVRDPSLLLQWEGERLANIKQNYSHAIDFIRLH